MRSYYLKLKIFDLFSPVCFPFIPFIRSVSKGLPSLLVKWCNRLQTVELPTNARRLPPKAGRQTQGLVRVGQALNHWANVLCSIKTSCSIPGPSSVGKMFVGLCCACRSELEHLPWVPKVLGLIPRATRPTTFQVHICPFPGKYVHRPKNHN